jgi:hypothetical protein
VGRPVGLGNVVEDKTEEVIPPDSFIERIHESLDPGASLEVLKCLIASGHVIRYYKYLIGKVIFQSKVRILFSHS